MFWIFTGFTIYLLLVVAERALVAVAPQELEVLRAEGAPSARRAFLLATEQLRPTLAALLLGRLWVKILVTAITVAWMMMQADLADWLMPAFIPGPWKLFTLVATITFVLATLFWGIKRFDFEPNGRFKPALFLRKMGGFIRFWLLLFGPFVKSENHKSNDSSAAPDSIVTTNDNQPAPVIQPRRDIELLKSIVKFGDVTVKQVMQPRSKIVAVENHTAFKTLLHLIDEAGFSRLPVYDEDLDNCIGVLYVKDLVTYLDAPDDFDWQQLVRPEHLLVPESKHINELLREFKQTRRHIALVVDEYGGIEGIVTLEDILEEITGEIRDEFDEGDEIPPFRRIDANTFEFEGHTLLNDVCRIAGLNPGIFDAVRDDADTLAGLVLELYNDIPSVGITVEWEQYSFSILAADQRRIERILLTIQEQQ